MQDAVPNIRLLLLTSGGIAIATGQSLGATTFRRRELGLTEQFEYYAGHMLFGAFPFVLLYPVAFVGVLAGTPKSVARRAWTLPALYVGAIGASFLSLSIHRPWCLIPMLPFLSVFLGTCLARALSRAPSRAVRVAITVALGVTVWIELPLLGVNPLVARAMNPPLVEGWAD